MGGVKNECGFSVFVCFGIGLLFLIVGYVLMYYSNWNFDTNEK